MKGPYLFTKIVIGNGIGKNIRFFSGIGIENRYIDSFFWGISVSTGTYQ